MSQRRVPTIAELGEIVDALASWQRDGDPVQLHSGDLGWRWRSGADELARALRVWRRDGQILAVGLVEAPDLIRMGIAPPADHDHELARQLVRDLDDPARGVLSAGRVAVEARFGAAFRTLLHTSGWTDGEAWTPLHRDLARPVESLGLRIEVVQERLIDKRVTVHRAAFPNSTFTAERWHAMASGPAYQSARCLVGFDPKGVAVAAITVWSAGVRRPGLIEPMGVHRDHRGHGYGRAITLTGAAALRDMGASSVIVATPSSNTAGVATYLAAGFVPEAEVNDFQRTA